MSRLRRLGLVALGWSLLACDPVEPSDQGQYDLAIELVDRLGVDGRAVLVGTQFELGISSVRVAGEVDPEQGGLQCASSSATGVLSKVGDIDFRVDAAGPGAVQFAAPSESCPANDDVLAQLGPDSWTVRGVDPSAALGRWIPVADSTALGWNAVPGPAGVWPGDFGLPLADARVAADGHFNLYPTLLERDAGARAEVRWFDLDSVITLPAHYAQLATYEDLNGERSDRDYVGGTLRAGQSVEASITILTNEFALPELQAVPITHITDLELVPVYYSSDEPEREWGPPAGVVAISRDAQGRRIVGAPLEWSVTRGRVFAVSEGFGDDVLEIGDCREVPREPQWRAATIEASLDGLVSAVDLEWVALPSDTTDPTSPACSASACDCSTTATPSHSALAGIGLLLLGAGLRRRRSHSP